MSTPGNNGKLSVGRSCIYLFAVFLLFFSLFLLTGACSNSPDGVSVLLTLEEYEELLSRINEDGVMVIPDDDVPLGEFSDGSDDIASRFTPLILELLNIEREKESLSLLSGEYAGLNDAARARANELTSLFSHTRPNGLQCFDALNEHNVSYRAAGENIAKGQPSPEDVVRSWMDSKGHRANILNGNYSNVGIEVTEDQSGTLFWVILFTN